MIFILLHYLLSFVTVTSPAHVSYAVLFPLLPQFLCPTVCVYGGTTVPRGVVGDRHLVTVAQGVAGGPSALGWGRTKGGGVPFGCMAENTPA